MFECVSSPSTPILILRSFSFTFLLVLVLHQLSLFYSPSWIFRISTNLETLKSSKIRGSDEKPPANPCPRDPAASFSSSCPWYGVGRLPNRNDSWKNSYLWFFSECCDEVVFRQEVRPQLTDLHQVTSGWGPWICRAFHSPLLRWWRHGRADNDSGKFYLLFSFPKCWTIYSSIVADWHDSLKNIYSLCVSTSNMFSSRQGSNLNSLYLCSLD